MALSLGLHVGESIYIGDSKLTLKTIKGVSHYIIEFEGNTFSITPSKGTEVSKDVFISAGVGVSSLARLAFSAPRSIRILREELYVQMRDV